MRGKLCSTGLVLSLLLDQFFQRREKKNFCWQQAKFIAMWRPYGKFNAARRSPNGLKNFWRASFLPARRAYAPGPGLPNKRGRIWGVSWGTTAEAGCAGCTKKKRFREKRLCNLTRRFYLTFFERCGIMRIPAAPAAQGRV